MCLITGISWALLLRLCFLSSVLLFPEHAYPFFSRYAKNGVYIVWLEANPAATQFFCFWDHRVCPSAADALGAAGLGWSNPACEQCFFSLPQPGYTTNHSTPLGKRRR